VIEVNTLTSKSINLKKYCHFAKDHDEIQVVEWINGEGFDVVIDDVQPQRFSMTYGQFDALQLLIAYNV
jgi:hypothetical protein